MARRKPMMGGMRGGMPMRDGMMGRGGKCQQYFSVLFLGFFFFFFNDMFRIFFTRNYLSKKCKY